MPHVLASVFELIRFSCTQIGVLHWTTAGLQFTLRAPGFVAGHELVGRIAAVLSWRSRLCSRFVDMEVWQRKSDIPCAFPECVRKKVVEPPPRSIARR